MLKKIINISFVLIGAITGYTLTSTFLYFFANDLSSGLTNLIYMFVVIVSTVLSYFIVNKTNDLLLDFLDRVELAIQRTTLYEIAISVAGLIIGLIVANLIAIPINKIDIIGTPIAILINFVFGYLGVGIAIGKMNDPLIKKFYQESFSDIGKEVAAGNARLLLDTSVIIDGRIVDICKTGILQGELVVASFVLEELRHIADSSDTLKRNRGRRGLDILNILQKELEYPVRIESYPNVEGGEVDDKLLKVASEHGYKIITVDYNLSKVAGVHGVQIININELAKALKPIALPGEEMTVQVIKDGKENGQGIGYLDDGTMIVVEGGRKYMGELVPVMVTSVLQTSAGRMIFAKPRSKIEQVVQ